MNLLSNDKNNEANYCIFYYFSLDFSSAFFIYSCSFRILLPFFMTKFSKLFWIFVVYLLSSTSTSYKKILTIIKLIHTKKEAEAKKISNAPLVFFYSPCKTLIEGSIFLPDPFIEDLILE